MTSLYWLFRYSIARAFVLNHPRTFPLLALTSHTLIGSFIFSSLSAAGVVKLNLKHLCVVYNEQYPKHVLEILRTFLQFYSLRFLDNRLCESIEHQGFLPINTFPINKFLSFLAGKRMTTAHTLPTAEYHFTP